MNSIKFQWVLLSCFILSVLFIQPASRCLGADKLNVVTTTSNLASIAEAVGGEHVSVTSIGSGDEDPHFIQAKPSYMMKARKADLWIRVGMELEIGYEGLILQGSRNPRIQINAPGHLDASEGILKLEVPTGKIDRSMGDVHPLGNPHYWLDPYNGRIIAKNICSRLKQFDPKHSTDYDANLASFLLKLDIAMFGSKLVEAAGGEKLWELLLDGRLDEFVREKSLTLGGWLAMLKPFEHSKIVTYHRSWTYFEHRFGIDVAAELEPKPGIPPGPAHILQVINTMKSERVRIILMEPFYNRDDADAVAKKTGAKVVITATAVNDRVKDYIGMLDNVVTKLTEALSQEAPK
jgi:zinc/manganese transport system substrate-binding protein